MRKLLFAICLGATGCVGSHTQVTSPDLGRQDPFGIIVIDGNYRYIIDPRTESCLLRSVIGGAMVHVSCAKLKKNVPEAAAFITWEPSDAAPAAPGTGTSSVK